MSLCYGSQSKRVTRAGSRAEMEQLEDVARHRQGAKRSRAQLEVEERFGEAFGVQGGQTRGGAALKRSRNL